MINTIIFDLGGVLIDWDPRYMYKSIFRTEEAMEYFLDRVCTSEWNEEQDGGRTIAEANKLLIDKHPQYETEILAFYGRWTEMLGGPISETVDILKQVKALQKYKVVALTNWSAETWPEATKRYDFLQLFEGILVSGKEKLKKPDKSIYKLLCEQYDIVPEEAYFIDDNERNIRAAQEFGLKTHHFRSSEFLIKELKNKYLL